MLSSTHSQKHLPLPGKVFQVEGRIDYPNMSVYRVYRFESVAETVTPKQAAYILSSHGRMRRDLRPGERSIDAMAHPRSAVLAEVLWPPKGGRDYDGLMKRLAVHVQPLKLEGVPYRPLQAGTPVGGWKDKALAKPEVMAWPLAMCIRCAGNYIVKIVSARATPLTVEKVEVMHGRQVLATAPTAEPQGVRDFETLYHFTLPEITASVPLLLRVTGKAEAPDKRPTTATLNIEKAAP